MGYLVDAPLDSQSCLESITQSTEDEKSTLVGILAGAYRWQDRQCGRDEGLRSCPFCLCAEADREHLWWSCPATVEVRDRFPDVCAAFGRLPPEAKMNGHVLLGRGGDKRVILRHTRCGSVKSGT